MMCVYAVFIKRNHSSHFTPCVLSFNVNKEEYGLVTERNRSD